MHGGRVLVYFIGVAMVVVALYLLFFQTGLNRWIPVGIAAAALLLIIGMMVMGGAEDVPESHHGGGHHGPEHGHH